ncbi:MAG: hypothetical protein DI628_01800 [Blastochloris viridis]|uniref:Sel1 repeat family protein n=1 Tax=Blastochloris viridis TaxID=1079 RepID=A0A6N4RED2_BLAVI|nr:MAG: hypothetical protein DI628_01800 [Blastochloris viridis]
MKFHALYVIGPLSFGLGANVFASTAKETQACNERAASYSQVSSPQQDFEAGEELMKNGCSDHAVQMWEKAAKGHHAQALFMLGLIYQGGDTGAGNIRANPRKAFPYFK